MNYEHLKQSAIELLNAEIDGEQFQLTRLDLGLSNENFELASSRQHFLVKSYRTDFPDASLVIQQQLAAQTNVTTRPIAWDREKRIALFEFWPGEVYQGQQWQCIIPLLVQLHQFEVVKNDTGEWSLDVPELLKRSTLCSSLKNQFQVERLMSTLPEYCRFSAYCHNDLVRENILSNGKEIRLIDFEFAGWHDVYFDLAALTVSLKLDTQQAETMLFSYHGLITAPHSVDMNKLRDYRLAYLSLCLEWYQSRGYELEANLLLNQLPQWTIS